MHCVAQATPSITSAFSLLISVAMMKIIALLAFAAFGTNSSSSVAAAVVPFSCRRLVTFTPPVLEPNNLGDCVLVDPFSIPSALAADIPRHHSIRHGSAGQSAPLKCKHHLYRCDVNLCGFAPWSLDGRDEWAMVAVIPCSTDPRASPGLYEELLASLPFPTVVADSTSVVVGIPMTDGASDRRVGRVIDLVDASSADGASMSEDSLTDEDTPVADEGRSLEAVGKAEAVGSFRGLGRHSLDKHKGVDADVDASAKARELQALGYYVDYGMGMCTLGTPIHGSSATFKTLEECEVALKHGITPASSKAGFFMDYGKGLCVEGIPVHGSSSLYTTYVKCCVALNNGRDTSSCYAPEVPLEVSGWYPDWSRTFEDGVCLNGVPPSKLPIYGSQIECCIGRYRDQKLGQCFLDMYGVGQKTVAPTKKLTPNPTQECQLVCTPTLSPTSHSTPTESPSKIPTTAPSTKSPTGSPSVSPSKSPTDIPTGSPSDSPSKIPTTAPSTKSPTGSPSVSPSKSPTDIPTGSPSNSPSKSPTESPTGSPSVSPSKSPTDIPTGSPSDSPSKNPTAAPATPIPTRRMTSGIGILWKIPIGTPSTKSPTGSPMLPQLPLINQ